MKALNLYLISQVDDETVFRQYTNILARRDPSARVRENEQESIHSLVRTVSGGDPDYGAWDRFFLSFSIAHIGKEFDLLKIRRDGSMVINIELKSEMTGEERIFRQLVQNRYYLGLITGNIHSYTYVSSTEEVFALGDDGKLRRATKEELRELLLKTEANDWLEEGIEKLFTTVDFLISPIGTPAKFLEGRYFLTQQQDMYRGRILAAIGKKKKKALFFALAGSPGTGKTLLLYNIASTLMESRQVLLIHCGALTGGHEYLARAGWNIVQVKSVRDSFDFSGYEAVLVDEAQRLSETQLERILTRARRHGQICIFAFDPKQILQNAEAVRKVCDRIGEISGEVMSLSDRIRSNKELNSFFRLFLESKVAEDGCRYEGIDVLFARTQEDGEKILKEYVGQGYQFIDIAVSGKDREEADLPAVTRYSAYSPRQTDEVIGQEFEKVVMILDDTFYYDSEGILRVTRHPDPRYLYDRLLYQDITRTREKLCLIIIDNFALFAHVTGLIKGRY